MELSEAASVSFLDLLIVFELSSSLLLLLLLLLLLWNSKER